MMKKKTQKRPDRNNSHNSQKEQEVEVYMYIAYYM